MSRNANIPHRYRILCTEDDGDSREALRLLLEIEGFEVTCAEDAAQAISLAKAEKFDLYLLDNWLPGMDGSLLCQKLREVDPITPVLFYSGAAMDGEKARALASGAQGYVIKPADPDYLVSEITRLILTKR
jgi:DNA-binding response OmpR family regulator